VDDRPPVLVPTLLGAIEHVVAMCAGRDVRYLGISVGVHAQRHVASVEEQSQRVEGDAGRFLIRVSLRPYGRLLARPLAGGRTPLGQAERVELVTATRTWSWSHSQKFARTSASMRSAATPVEADSGNVTVTVIVCTGSGEVGP